MDGAINRLELRGFDASHHTGRTVKVGCSQCAALVINGIACHETGCVNQVHECAGCMTFVPVRQKYCADCA